MIECSDHSLSPTLPVLRQLLWSHSLVSHKNYDIFFLQSLPCIFHVFCWVELCGENHHGNGNYPSCVCDNPFVLPTTSQISICR